MKRLAGEDRVGLVVAERDRLGAPGERSPPPARTSSSTARIASSGSTATTRENARHQRPRQLAGAGAEVEHRRLVGQAELGDDPVEQLGRPLRPAQLVLARGAPERVRRRLL